METPLSLPSRPEEAARLDRAIAETLEAITSCADARRVVDLRIKLERLRTKRSRLQWPVGFQQA